MEAKELMLNDLVLFDNKVCKIAGTNAYRDCVELYYVDDEDNYVIGKYAKHIQPIPLTPEILEKNGWLCDNLCCEFHNSNAFVICGRVYPFCIFDGVQISYVHELQQALRLCKLNEISDNFKV